MGKKGYFIFLGLSLELVTYVLIGAFLSGKVDDYFGGSGIGVVFVFFLLFTFWIFRAFFVLKKFLK